MGEAEETDEEARLRKAANDGFTTDDPIIGCMWGQATRKSP